MKIGDVVYDSTYEMNGVIVDESIIGTEVSSETMHNIRIWIILYENGQTDKAFDNELEMVSESR